MATFTIELWRMIEGHEDDPTKVSELLGLDDYPIFDETYRPVLNRAIIENFNNQEIGFETEEMFRFAMGRRMRLIMPTYNLLYLSTRQQFDPLSTVDLRTMTRDTSDQKTKSVGESESTSMNKAGTRAVAQNTPQMALKGNADYASGATDTTSKSDSAGTSNEQSEVDSQGVNEGDSHVTGYQGNPASILMEYRRSIINVTAMVLDELTDLFMGIWNTSDHYTETEYSNVYPIF